MQAYRLKYEEKWWFGEGEATKEVGKRYPFKAVCSKYIPTFPNFLKI